MTIINFSELLVGQSSTTDEIAIYLEAWGGMTFRVQPASGQLRWSSHGKNRIANLDAFSYWRVTAKDEQSCELQLDNDVIINVYASGIIRFRNLDDQLVFIATATQEDDAYTSVIDANGWYVTSTDEWSLSGNRLSTEPNAVTSVFFTEREDLPGWFENLNWLADEDLRIGGSPNEKLARAVRMGMWAQHDRDKAMVLQQMQLETMTIENLTRWAQAAFRMRPRVGESRGAFLIRVKGEIAVRLAPCTYDAILQFVADALGLEPGNVVIARNLTSGGATEHAYFRVDVNTDIIQNVEPDEVAQVVADVEAIITRMAGAGIQGVVNVVGGAVYDTGVYDGGTYG